MLLLGLGPGIFSRGCPTCNAVQPVLWHTERRTPLSHWEHNQCWFWNSPFVNGHSCASLSPSSPAHSSNHCSSPSTFTCSLTLVSSKHWERLQRRGEALQMLNSAKEEHCPMGLGGRESYEVNSSFHTRMQETTWLFTDRMGSWGSAEPLWRKGCISVWKGSFSGWQMTGQCFYVLCLWSATLLLCHWLFLFHFYLKGFLLLMIHASQTPFSITN